MQRYRRYLWMWAAVLALSTGARAVESAPSSGESQKAARAEIARLIGQLNPLAENREELDPAAYALLDKGAAAVPALEELLKPSQADGLRHQAEQLLALIRGGETVGGWQATLKLKFETVHEGEALPMAFTLTNRSTAEQAYRLPGDAGAIQPRQNLAAGKLSLVVRRTGPDAPEELRAVMDRYIKDSGDSPLRVEPGASHVTPLYILPDDHGMKRLAEATRIRAPLSHQAYLPKGRYTVQVLCRVDEKGPLVASAPAEFAVQPWDWKALDEAERAKMPQHTAAAEAALEKDEALRAKLRGAAAKLDDEDWQARETATKTLLDAGLPALPELLRLQTTNGSLEARTRAVELIDALRAKVVLGGEPQAGLRARLRLDRQTVKLGEKLPMTFDVVNVSKETKKIFPVHEFSVSGFAEVLDRGDPRASIEIRREDNLLAEMYQSSGGGLLPLEQEDSAELAPDAVRTRKIEMTVTNQQEKDKLEEQTKEEHPFNIRVPLPAGRYRVRVVYFAYRNSLVKDAADDVKSNWVAFEVRE